MSKKLTLEYVKKHIEGFGYKCLFENYINSQTKLKVQCGKGHQYEVTWGNFQYGKRCQKCFNNSKKRTIEEVRYYIEKFGYKCLSKEYINNRGKLNIQCNKGHIYKAEWSSFQRGKRCSICYGNKRKTLEEVSKYVKEFGYKCLSKKYSNISSRLNLVCPKGHNYKTTLHKFNSSRRCKICSLENRSGENSYQWKNYTEKDRENIFLYRNEITRLSNINYIKYFYFINPNKLRRGDEYHLDHIYSVIDGFNNKIPPKIIANPYNLRIINNYENTKKSGNSHISLKQLHIFYLCFLLKQKMEGT